MRWQSGRRSSNVEDRRGVSAGGAPLKIGGGAVVIVIIGLLMGKSPVEILQAVLTTQQGAPSANVGAPRQPSAEENQLADFVSVVLADTEDTWPGVLSTVNINYEAPKLVLFTDAVASACGTQSSAVGPFYCPGDETVYIDLGFYAELQSRFGAPGDFAQAYVIAHEVGHHVQNLLGTSERVHNQQRNMSEADANELSVRLELQADCYAGVWAHHADKARSVLEAGDVDEALNAASAIGDDRLQREATGRVVPESFTHGTSAQRARWFRTGLAQGNLLACDTFTTTAL
ncbi:MAG: zinc metallopeptidase [Myxococcales bacterium]|nr:zinc metallopeptidase [Myxococcales bacterium]MCB9530202.1 zinc metallopeptidase [Myxococcales bacterium]MCB9533715.1 zinc metallopeptidase [Myxococcales bacterium]